VTSARLRVGDRMWEQTVAPEQKAAVFEVDLEAGETQVQSYLCDDAGCELGAYYVYVTRV
jgi:hypothetical protein